MMQFLEKNAEHAAIFLVVMVQVWIYLVVPTDNFGDASDYMKIAEDLFGAGQQINFNRMLGYPLLLKIFSINLKHINLFFLFQSVTFVFSLVYFARKVIKTPVLRCIVYAPALIPSVAYMQKLIFPDGVITSLILLTLACLLCGEHTKALVLSFGLFVIKLVFVFLVIYAVLNLLKGKIGLFNNKREFYLIYLLGIVALAPVVYFLKPFPLYQTVVQVPSSFVKYIDPVSPYESLDFECGGVVRTLREKSLLDKITVHSSDEFYMPFGRGFADKYGCDQADLRRIQRDVIWRYLTEAPSYQLRKLSYNYPRAIYVVPQNIHLNYMLYKKNKLLSDGYPYESHYEEGQLKLFEKHGITPPRQPGQVLLGYAAKYNYYILWLFSRVSIGISILILFMVLVQKKYNYKIETALIFILSYGFAVTCFAFVYDRYVYVNLFLWMSIVAMAVDEASWLRNIKMRLYNGQAACL